MTEHRFLKAPSLFIPGKTKTVIHSLDHRSEAFLKHVSIRPAEGVVSDSRDGIMEMRLPLIPPKLRVAHKIGFVYNLLGTVTSVIDFFSSFGGNAIC